MKYFSYGRHSLSFKFIALSISIQFIMLTLLVLNSIRLTQNYLIDQTIFRINELKPLLNASLAAPLIQEDIATLNEIADQIVRDRGIHYLAIRNSTGKLVISKGHHNTDSNNDRHQHKNTYEQSFTEIQKVSIQLNGYIAGELSFKLDTRFIEQAVTSVRNQSIFIAAIEIILTMLILTLLTFTLSKNLISLANAVKGFPHKKIKLNLSKNTKDEVGALVTVISEMTEAIALRDLELYKYQYELEDTVKKRTLELEASNKELESFSYSVSHDLRAPLRSISSFSTILLDDYMHNLDEQATDYLNRVINNTKHMSELIDSLLLLSQTIKAPLNLEPVDLTQLVKDSYTLLQESTTNRSISLELADNITVNADPILIKTVIDNLIGNAWKYTKENKHAKIQFESFIEGKNTVYSIKDNGIGFNMLYAEKIFIPFQRIHNKKDSKYSGMGIGLATVFKIIQRHHGKIWFQSKENEGASFFFTLPQ